MVPFAKEICHPEAPAQVLVQESKKKHVILICAPHYVMNVEMAFGRIHVRGQKCAKMEHVSVNVRPVIKLTEKEIACQIHRHKNAVKTLALLGLTVPVKRLVLKKNNYVPTEMNTGVVKAVDTVELKPANVV